MPFIFFALRVLLRCLCSWPWRRSSFLSLTLNFERYQTNRAEEELSKFLLLKNNRLLPKARRLSLIPRFIHVSLPQQNILKGWYHDRFSQFKSFKILWLANFMQLRNVYRRIHSSTLEPLESRDTFVRNLWQLPVCKQNHKVYEIITRTNLPTFLELLSNWGCYCLPFRFLLRFLVRKTTLIEYLQKWCHPFLMLIILF